MSMFKLYTLKALGCVKFTFSKKLVECDQGMREGDKVEINSANE